MNFQPRPPADDQTFGATGDAVVQDEGQYAFAVPDLAVLQATDALLDRLSPRRPLPDDLDDPLVAALALFAGEIDLDEVPVATTRGAWDRHTNQTPQKYSGESGGETFGFFQPARRDSSTVSPIRAYVDLDAVETPVDVDPAGARTPARDQQPPVLRRDPALATPFGHVGDPSLSRSADAARPTDPGSRAVRLRLVPTVAAAAAGLLLSMGAAAAVTGGESVNPVTVVDRFFSHQTADPADQYAPLPHGSGGSRAQGDASVPFGRRSSPARELASSVVPGAGSTGGTSASTSPTGSARVAKGDVAPTPHSQDAVPNDGGRTDPTSAPVLQPDAGTTSADTTTTTASDGPSTSTSSSSASPSTGNPPPPPPHDRNPPTPHDKNPPPPGGQPGGNPPRPANGPRPNAGGAVAGTPMPSL